MIIIAQSMYLKKAQYSYYFGNLFSYTPVVIQLFSACTDHLELVWLHFSTLQSTCNRIEVENSLASDTNSSQYM